MMTPAPTSSNSNSNNSRRVPLDKRKRTETSCDKCKSRKQKCRKEPGHDACRYCLNHNIECLTTQPRKKRLYGSVEGLGHRLALLESLVKGLLPDADVANLDEMRQLGESLGITLPDAGDGDDAGLKSGSDREGDDSMSLLPDQQGQVQYIGPASSFSFHVRLRTLVGKSALREFVLFGRNAADHETLEEGDEDGTGDGDSNGNHRDHHALSTPGATPTGRPSRSPVNQRAASTPAPSDGPSLESLISAYFDHINIDFPVLHEASFREAYEAWQANTANADPAWLCSFLCVLLLARRVARVTFPEDQERLWWRRVQTLLPVVIFTSSVAAVQAMMLAAMHLHNTNHRDACWNLTGTAVRISFAIGLHQDKVSTLQTPLVRELRKRLWWTLYAFEQMQVSSYDRPSAIQHPVSKIGCPNERIIGMAAYSPPDYGNWFNRLVVHLAAACRAPKTIRPNTSEESYVGPLSPAAAVLRDCERWRDTLPQHLRIEALESSPPAFQRPLLLLHALYHYTITVLCRGALLARASILSKEDRDSPNTALITMAESCIRSGKELSNIILKLESLRKFDAVTWWDVWYTLACSSILVLDLVCLNKMGDAGISESRILLSQLAELAHRHLRNPHMPGTLVKFCSLVPELHSMVDAMNTTPPLASTSKPAADNPPETAHLPPPQELQQHHQHQHQHTHSHQHSHPHQHQHQHQHQHPHQQPDIVPYSYPPQSPISSGAYMFTENMPGRFYPEQEYAGTTYPNARYDRTTQMQFMDFTINNIQDWNWGELGSLLGNEAAPNGHGLAFAPPGHPPG